jgi:LuxR family maltose regulon positive regulatory protein
MASQLLATKFYVPRPRSGLVPRPSLTGRLLGGTESKLTLISAPAGFGKSTLLAEWLAAPIDGSVTAWLSLDPGDDHPSTFWPHLIAALQSARPGIGASSLSLLESPDLSIQAILAPLLNELNELPDDIVLVLDDYHTIDSQEIQVGMTFMLDHLPAHVRLVIATRTDPALPLARLRARGELIEIRAGDLRFTSDEADAYFNGVMGLGLTARDVAALEGRTEGWIAALHLAGLSMQGRDDLAGFIAGFAGDDRYIVDYLVEEVLQRESEQVRSFLLQTSILARISGPLADAVTGQDGGQATLEALHRRNLFLIPLDDRRRWYRYHHLFADVLQARLFDDRPALVAGLHRQAAEWYAKEGEHAEAIRHALAGKDFSRAADLVELAIPASRQARQELTSRRWIDALPIELIRVRPVLSDSFAGSRLVRGEVEGVDAALRDAEHWVAASREGTADAMIVVDEQAFRDLPASIAIHRAGLARLLGDVDGTMAHARTALELVGEDDLVSRAAAAALLGLASWSSANLEAASRWYDDAIADLEKAGYLPDVIGCSIALADIRRAQGRLSEAMRILQRGLALATRPGESVLRGAADMHVGLSEILRERGDLGAASEHLGQSRALGEENGLPQNPYRSRVAAALIRLAEGDPDGALELLDDAARRYDGDFSPDVRPVAALRARVLIAQEKLTEAWAWARHQGLTAADDLDYLHEFKHITLARLLVAEGIRDRSDERIASASGLLERLLEAAEAGGRAGSAIDILVVQALANHARGDQAGALAWVDRAVALAEPEGYVRTFIDEGPPMMALLKLAAKDRNASSYVRQLLAASTVAGSVETAVAQPLIEPLSERELEVLRLLESDLDGPDIARELTVSLPTVRTHTRNIYSKLGVTNRRAAVRRAAELGLLSRTRDRRPTA